MYRLHALLACVALGAAPLNANILLNSDFSQGDGNLGNYEAFASFSKGAATINSAWGLADAPVVAPGNGTAVFGMNTQLPTADSFWVGATQAMSFQQNFWTPDNNAAVSPTVDLYGQEITFSGNAVVSELYASGNSGVAFVQFLDTSYNATLFETVDISTLGVSGAFSITVTAPANGLNIIQVGFRNSGIVATAGEMTISNLSVTAVPEPSTYALLAGLSMLGLVVARRRRKSVI